MAKCDECKYPLKEFAYLIGGKKLCKKCSLELISDIKEYKVNLKENAHG